MSAANAEALHMAARSRRSVATCSIRSSGSRSFQNWQSEFLSTAVLVVLSIFLRHQGSPESKPVGAANSETGD